MKKYQEVEEKLNNYKKDEINRIKEKYKEKPFKRFWRLVWFYCIYVWKWLFTEFRDWHFIVLFFIVCAVVGIEVWLPVVLWFFNRNNEFGAWCLRVAGVCEAFWLAPFTPFIPICIVITMGIKRQLNVRKLKDSEKVVK